MAHTFEELVTKQRTADQANAEVLRLRDTYNKAAEGGGWTEEQTEAYEVAWRAWRDQAEAVQAAVTEHANGEGKSRYDVEADVKKAARHPEAAEV